VCSFARDGGTRGGAIRRTVAVLLFRGTQKYRINWPEKSVEIWEFWSPKICLVVAMNREHAQRRLVEDLQGFGICDARVLAAMEAVPREVFVPAEVRHAAYEDRALPIEEGQTISQPYMVALMTEQLALIGDETVLEIGTGSGYQAAILSRLARRVISIERIPALSESARRVLDELGYRNVECHIGDGSLGWPEDAPYEAIIVTAGAPSVPQNLYDQLTDGGRLVIPVGTEQPLVLQRIEKLADGPRITDVCECTFVPLIGEAGWGSKFDEG